MAAKSDEISLKELILMIGRWVRFLVSRWKTILLVGLAGAVIGLGYSFLIKPTYTGALTFVLANESKAGGISSIAGQFGIDVGGNMTSEDAAFEGENIIELLKSRRIVHDALFKSVPPKGNLLVNLVGEKSGLYEKWRDNKHLYGSIPISSSSTVPLQDSLIDVMHDYIVKHYLVVSKPDKKLSFYTLVTTSPDETISVYLTRNLVEAAAGMYIATKTKTAKNNLDMLQHEADSLRGRLEGMIYQTASKTDQTFNLNPALQAQRAGIQQSQVQAQVLGVAYGEVIKNLELAKISLQKSTPLYQVIDAPDFPLVRKKMSKILATLAGAVLFSVLAALWLCARRALWLLLN